jgi:regulator of replication initiation timing
VLRRLSRDALCSADDFEKDKVACLERQVDALTRELADLRRDLPRLIEEGVQRAMEPRLHR